ncbi:Zn-ribbon domain-containing OB-fold protein [Dehalococcoidia bacterium]|nr:Zn-ribbon domain-containing OB-fold protein [Dehalococcoidia bacterium]
MEYKLTHKAYTGALRENRLLGLKCNACGGCTVPPKKVCIECASEDLDIVELSGRGEIRTFTVIRVAPEGFQAPYIVGIVELDEGPWLMGNIIDVDCNEATMDMIGRRVRLGHAVIPGDKYSAGERVTATFGLENYE